MEVKQAYEKPELTVHGDMERVTQVLKHSGGFDGIQIELQDGTIVTGS